MSTTIKKKTVYCLRTRLVDSDPWSETAYFMRKKDRDNTAATNRIIGGIRTHSFEERKTDKEIEDIYFQ